ncbi:hypothetical protein ETD86_04685 [Nonomuraea turkmeniaca]|uniref:Tetracycline repressor TetR C-terminal domain-containing protein n=1 Tax=Nonomuraea turkmeniaca TaxID=103838 RepID=A0A5S4GEB1_9ACTN|nr:TetR/AcrR family transcriptional regulator C-terminal domain-containing protein [Nonomuraea turkmeniaca]TMR24430.1 hypothetical protein ETD86_04685 [Nonomuraea turkmeniaca]
MRTARRLGSRLGAGATSLYRHVANKDELFELAVDEVYGQLALPAPDDPAAWRATVTEVAHGLRATILRHPWVAAKLGEAGLSYLGPNVLRRSEHLLAVLERGGFSPREADRAMNAVVAYVLGVATGGERGQLRPWPPAPPRRPRSPPPHDLPVVAERCDARGRCAKGMLIADLLALVAREPGDVRSG